MLSELAERICRALLVSLDGMDTVPSVSVIVPQAGPERWNLHRFTTAEEKRRFFDTLAETAREERPQAIGFGGEAWVTVVPPGVRREALVITAQDARMVCFLEVPFRRRPGRPADIGKRRSGLIAQSELPAGDNALKFFREESACSPPISAGKR